MFYEGQRVVSEAEPDLGLGMVGRLQGRRALEVHFPAVGESRSYRPEAAPLRRLVLKPGQQATARDGRTLRIEHVEPKGELLVYHGQGMALEEAELEDKVPLGGALDRLTAGHVGLPGDLELRRDGWLLRAQSLSGATRGLAGARVRLLDHQLYVAAKVAAMEAPRVLLADEVGLGKTIEAGLIFCALRALGRAGRVLIVVPEPLVHQWLAEMVRKFNELFRVLSEEDEEEDPYELARRVIVPLPLLDEDLACRHRWDLVIVDEAHHLPEEPSNYRAVQQLAACSRGLLLLTATPERGGLETEFALLRLVDPDRFPNVEEFLAERPRWRQVSEAARDPLHAPLHELFPEDEGLHRLVREGDREAVLQALVDRHGPGRVLVRNRRERLGGLFPGRRLHEIPVGDDRAGVVADFLAAHPDEKVLLIAALRETVVDLQEQLRQRSPARTAVFHEGLSLVERDRQAVYFADPEGAQILLCSEIGSEGRNFQFAHHLVLYDLPLHPDRLEQRIGRLDRIGQTEVVQVHALYRPGGGEERLLRWHRDGLRSFQGPVEGGDEILRQVVPDLDVERTRELVERYRREARENVDVLVDLNSFREDEGCRLRDTIEAAEADPGLESYLSRVLDRFGVQDEELATEGLRRIRPGDLMFVDVFPGLRGEEGNLATFRREIALVREEVEFLTADHPLVDGALSLLLDGGEGTACAVRMKSDAPGLLAQFLFVLEAVGPAALELPRHLPPTPVVITVDLAGRAAAEPTSPLERLAGAAVTALSAKLGDRLDRLAEAARRLAEARLEPARRAAEEEAGRRLREEQERLEELQRVNPAVPDAELEGHLRRTEETLRALHEAAPRLDAVRLVLLTS